LSTFRVSLVERVSDTGYHVIAEYTGTPPEKGDEVVTLDRTLVVKSRGFHVLSQDEVIVSVTCEVRPPWALVHTPVGAST
jgi:hypothetical protein